MSNFKIPLCLLLLFAASFNVAVAGSDHEAVQQILADNKAPAGVVFEIAVADADALQWAIPRIRQYSEQLRNKYQGLELAVVTHGREQFALQKDNADEYEEVHKEVEQMSRSGKIPVHICQTFASWNGVDAEDFPSYVTVSATGPQQVNDYLELGYVLVEIRRP